MTKELKEATETLTAEVAQAAKDNKIALDKAAKDNEDSFKILVRIFARAIRGIRGTAVLDAAGGCYQCNGNCKPCCMLLAVVQSRHTCTQTPCALC